MNLGFALVNAGQKKVLVYMGGWPSGPPPDTRSRRARRRKVLMSISRFYSTRRPGAPLR
jgi:hypothetical protein